MKSEKICVDGMGTLRLAVADAQPCETQLSLFALANGSLGILGVFDELATTPCLILPQIYVKRPISYHEWFPGYADSTDTRILCPSPLAFTLLIDGEAFDFSAATCEGELIRCAASGQLQRKLVWTGNDGRRVRVETMRIAPPRVGACLATRLHIEAVNFTAELSIIPFIPGHHAESELSKDPRISGRLQQNWRVTEESTLSNTARQSVLESPGVRLHYIESFSGETAWSPDGTLFSATARAGNRLSVERIIQIGVDFPPPLIDRTFSNLVELSRKSAADQLRFAPSITGNAPLSGAMLYSFSQVLDAAPASPDFSIAAKGLSGEGYEGHYFWDTEAFMLPVIALQDPDRARNLLAYRIAKLPEARNHARGMGHAAGALYPWRTIAGNECSSHYPTGSAQYHINGAIAFAIDFYCNVAGDPEFLLEAAETVFETVRIWPQIGRFDSTRGGAFCLYGVTGPDEYSALVDNDFYTNAIAKRHFEIAAKLARRLQTERGDDFRRLADRIGLDAGEVELWENAARQMLLPFDSRLGISAQDDTFLSKPKLGTDLQTAAKGRPLLMQYHPLVLFRHQVAKQGNVTQATAMGLVNVPVSIRSRNLAYYNDVTVHDSTLSPVAFAIEAARLGEEEQALAFLDDIAFVDLHDRHGNASHGLHMAAAAGAWLALAQGWAGMAVSPDVLAFAPHVPSAWESYSLSVLWRGSRIKLEIDQACTTYILLDGPPVRLRDHGRIFELGNSPVAMPGARLKAVIFDLDGVLTDTAEDHFQAWSALARNHGMEFDRHDNEAIKGVDRAGSLQFILDKNGRPVDPATFEAMLREKNADYQKRIEAYDPSRLFPGILELLDECHRNGILVAVASASRNAPSLLGKLGILHKFDYVANAATISAPKPAPDIFLDCASALGVSPAQCVGIEDSKAGITGIVAAGMASLGIGSSETLPHAVRCLSGTEGLSLSLIQDTLSEFARTRSNGIANALHGVCNA